MNLFRVSTVVLFAALASACASAPPAGSSASSAEPVVIDSTPGNGESHNSAPVDGSSVAEAAPPTAGDPVSAPMGEAATVETPAANGNTSAEQDFAAIYGQEPYDPIADPTLPAAAQLPKSYDPWEKYNRKVHTFNNAVDRTIAKPLARAYVEAVPRPVRLGVSNFFDNLGQPLTLVNQLLQGKPKAAGQTLGRFVLNSTLGIGGLFDPATDAKLPRGREDFGQTLGVWGWRQSRYVELPLFGPRTVRDVLGLAGDMPLSPVRQIEQDKTRIFLQGLNLVDTRAQLLSLDSLRDGAVDDYTLVRDSWMQRRAYQIEGSKQGDNEDSLPDYLLDENNPTVPVDAMPMPDISTPGP
ncbi:MULTISPECIES: VacJ family lipoprotein [unclassified Pseudoxanthomonas]|uniref:MlaA family lipoprotein n=1 Tax=unclassified Pseudoxanthomonas TaxID=2645906 RepID=UPI0030787BD5